MQFCTGKRHVRYVLSADGKKLTEVSRLEVDLLPKPLEVEFTDLSENLPDQWEWDFNSDGLADSHTEEILPTNGLLVRILEGFGGNHVNGAATRFRLFDEGVIAKTGGNRMMVDIVAYHSRFQRARAEQRDQGHDFGKTIGHQLANQVFHAA